MANFVLVAGARLGAWAWDEVVPYLRAAGQGAHPLTLSGLADKRGPGATLTEPAVLARPLDKLPATYVQCLLAGAEPSDDVAKLLTSKHWRLVEMDTGHWPMFSQPRRLARILLEAAGMGGESRAVRP